eukprot:937952_1
MPIRHDIRSTVLQLNEEPDTGDDGLENQLKGFLDRFADVVFLCTIRTERGETFESMSEMLNSEVLHSSLIAILESLCNLITQDKTIRRAMVDMGLATLLTSLLPRIEQWDAEIDQKVYGILIDLFESLLGIGEEDQSETGVRVAVSVAMGDGINALMDRLSVEDEASLDMTLRILASCLLQSRTARELFRENARYSTQIAGQLAEGGEVMLSALDVLKMASVFHDLEDEQEDIVDDAASDGEPSVVVHDIDQDSDRIYYFPRYSSIDMPSIAGHLSDFDESEMDMVQSQSSSSGLSMLAESPYIISDGIIVHDREATDSLQSNAQMSLQSPERVILSLLSRENIGVLLDDHTGYCLPSDQYSSLVSDDHNSSVLSDVHDSAHSDDHMSVVSDEHDLRSYGLRLHDLESPLGAAHVVVSAPASPIVAIHEPEQSGDAGEDTPAAELHEATCEAGGEPTSSFEEFRLLLGDECMEFLVSMIRAVEIDSEMGPYTHFPLVLPLLDALLSVPRNCERFLALNGLKPLMDVVADSSIASEHRAAALTLLKVAMRDRPEAMRVFVRANGLSTLFRLARAPGGLLEAVGRAAGGEAGAENESGLQMMTPLQDTIMRVFWTLSESDDMLDILFAHSDRSVYQIVLHLMSHSELPTSVLTLATGLHQNLLSHQPSSEWFLKHGGAEACMRMVEQNVDCEIVEDTLNAVQNACANSEAWVRCLVEIGAVAQLVTFIEARSEYLAPCFTAIDILGFISWVTKSSECRERIVKSQPCMEIIIAMLGTTSSSIRESALGLLSDLVEERALCHLVLGGAVMSAVTRLAHAASPAVRLQALMLLGMRARGDSGRGQDDRAAECMISALLHSIRLSRETTGSATDTSVEGIRPRSPRNIRSSRRSGEGSQTAVYEGSGEGCVALGEGEAGYSIEKLTRGDGEGEIEGEIDIRRPPSNASPTTDTTFAIATADVPVTWPAVVRAMDSDCARWFVKHALRACESERAELVAFGACVVADVLSQRAPLETELYRSAVSAINDVHSRLSKHDATRAALPEELRAHVLRVSGHALRVSPVGERACER